MDVGWDVGLGGFAGTAVADGRKMNKINRGVGPRISIDMYCECICAHADACLDVSFADCIIKDV